MRIKKKSGSCLGYGRKVFIGMSGGVDSSISAALLKEEGYDVTGVFIKTWSPDWLPCTWREERRDAMRVAAKLRIPLITLDLEKEYKEEVVDYMINEYKAGRVPNPDVMCNKVIKFGAFFDFAMKHGADFVATGHYAQIRPTTIFSVHGMREGFGKGYKETGLPAHGREGKFATKPVSLLTNAVDHEKDQTYFLWTLKQRELSHTLFPIGHLKKAEVRNIARRLNLPNAEKKDSQGLCFMGKIDVKDFLKHYIKEKEGRVLNEKGEVIGKHSGAVFFTMGERHGFHISKKSPNDEPYYVIDKDIKKNTITVSSKKESPSISKRELFIKNVNWNQGLEPDSDKVYQAKIRYRQTAESCRIEKQKDGVYKIVFDTGQIAPTPGQSVVIYDQDICLGGGIIV